MLSRKLQKYPFKTYHEFLSLRHKLQGFGDPKVTRLGGSDIGVIMVRQDGKSHDNYRSRIELYHQLISETPPVHFHNLFTWKGSWMEKPSMKECWSYLDPTNPTHEVFLENVNNRKAVRKFRDINYTYVNPEFPYFAINLDYQCSRYKDIPEGVVEVKNTSSMATDKWEAGVAPSHIFQVVTQIHTSGHRYGEIFQLKDATYPEIIPFTKEQTTGVFNQIVEAAEEFVGRVDFVKKELAKGIQGEEKKALIDEYEPLADDGKATEDYLKDKFKNLDENLPMEGDMATMSLAKEYLQYGLTKKEAEQDQRLVKSKLLQVMLHHDTKEIDFGSAGKVANYGRFTVSPRLLKDA